MAIACYQCRITLNGRQQSEDHFGRLSSHGKKHKKTVKKALCAAKEGTVLQPANEGDPVWVIGALNMFNRFIPDVRERVSRSGYKCLHCSRPFEKWDEMVAHLSEPKEKTPRAGVPWMPCVDYADDERRRRREMNGFAKALINYGIRASSESCGHLGCENAAVLTGACPVCEAVNLFCPDHSYCCRCHHWYEPSCVSIDEDICPCGSGKEHCRPGHVCGVCDGLRDAPTDNKSISVLAMAGQNMKTAMGFKVQEVAGSVVVQGGKDWEPSMRCTWKPPCHCAVQLPTLSATVPAPSWYNDVRSGAIKMPAKVQTNATCGLHAVNHLLACSPDPGVAISKRDFEECGLQAHVGDSAANLLDPRTGNYEFTVLHANLAVRNLSVFPMTADDFQWRWEEPFCEHVVPTGYHKVVGYLLRVPLHGGHWITLLPARVMTMVSPAETLLCDSMHPEPFLLTREETRQMLRACADDATTGECHSKTGFVCFLVTAAELRPRWQVLFQVSYAGGDYATELVRLCRKYGVTATSSGSYMVQGQYGKQFKLLFYGQPQLAPDADKLDFPLIVWKTQEGHADTKYDTPTGIHRPSCIGRVDTDGCDTMTPTTIHEKSTVDVEEDCWTFL